MKSLIPFKRYPLIVLVALSALFASACAPSRIGTSWGALENVTVNDQPRVLIAYNNWTILLDPATGKVAPLLNSDGELRYDDQGKVRSWELDGNSYDHAQFYSRPLLRTVDGTTTLLLPTFTDKLLTVDLTTARIEDPAGVTLSGPIVADIAEDDTTYYVPLYNHDVVALDKTTLAEKWRFVTTKGIWAKPLLADAVVYVSTADHLLYALNAETGKELWDKPADLNGSLGASPLLVDGYLYAGSIAHEFFKVDAKSGEIVAQIEVNNWIWSTPTLGSDGLLYFGDLGGWVYAVQPSDLSVVWKVQASDRGIRPSPLVTDKAVIVASRNGKIIWLNRADGTVLFAREIEGAPEILSDILLVEANEAASVPEPFIVVSTVNMSHLVVAYTLDGGNQRWVYGR